MESHLKIVKFHNIACTPWVISNDHFYWFSSLIFRQKRLSWSRRRNLRLDLYSRKYVSSRWFEKWIVSTVGCQYIEETVSTRRRNLFQIIFICHSIILLNHLRSYFRYKSPTLEVHTPVVGFGFQEPCNDPQNFCYLWVLYESESKNGSCLPFAVMYGILYKKVTNISTYGRHYRVNYIYVTWKFLSLILFIVVDILLFQNFVHCKKRFDLDVDLERCVNGRCIASSVVSNTPSNILRHAGANGECILK